MTSLYHIDDMIHEMLNIDLYYSYSTFRETEEEKITKNEEMCCVIANL